MSQRKLNALLFELQTARSPLAQAKILARAWRTVRELSPTDRKLLARHAGFDGAEEILEGLASKKGGMAPAMLLQALANARNTDGSTLRNLLDAFRDPERREEAVVESLGYAAELLRKPGQEEPETEVEEALGQLQAVEKKVEESPEEALAALSALKIETEGVVEDEEEGQAEGTGVSPETVPEPSAPPPMEPEFKLTMTPSPPLAGRTVRKPSAGQQEIDWSRWEPAAEKNRPAPAPRPEAPPRSPGADPPKFDAHKVLGAMGAESSIFSRLRVLRRELAGFKGSSLETVREMVEVFPEGWARRRAASALLEAGIPANPREAVDLIAGFSREIDRRWCLGILARTGRLRGRELERALEMLDSPAARRRVEAAAELR